MAATLQLANYGRGPNVFPNVAAIVVTINGNGATYATSTGGLPIDLTGILQGAAPPGFDAPNYIQALNPADVVGVMAYQLSTNGFLPSNLVVGTPTYTAVPWMTSTNETGVPGILATCPATIRLYGTGASNAARLAEVADGANSDVFTVLLLVNKSGANN